MTSAESHYPAVKRKDRQRVLAFLEQAELDREKLDAPLKTNELETGFASWTQQTWNLPINLRARMNVANTPNPKGSKPGSRAVREA